jgi:hypothetical protein
MGSTHITFAALNEDIDSRQQVSLYKRERIFGIGLTSVESIFNDHWIVFFLQPFHQILPDWTSLNVYFNILTRELIFWKICFSSVSDFSVFRKTLHKPYCNQQFSVRILYSLDSPYLKRMLFSSWPKIDLWGCFFVVGAGPVRGTKCQVRCARPSSGMEKNSWEWWMQIIVGFWRVDFPHQQADIPWRAQLAVPKGHNIRYNWRPKLWLTKV